MGGLLRHGGVVGASLTEHILLATPDDRSPYRARRTRGILHCCCACPGTGSGADVTGRLTGLWGGSGGAREPPTTQGHLSFGEHGMDEAVGPASGSGELSDAGPLLVLCLEVGGQLGAGLPSDADALLEFRHELPLSASEQSRCRGDDGHLSFVSGYPDGLPDRTASNRGYAATHPRRHHPRTCCRVGECLPRFASEVKHPALERRRPPRACEWRPPHLGWSMEHGEDR